MAAEPKDMPGEAADESAAAAPPEGPVGGTASGGALVEPPAEAVSRLESELSDAKDRFLRLAADFENFKKRMVRERAETASRAQADVVMRLVDALDDLARFAHVDPAQADARTIHDGVNMVERKFWKELAALGLLRIDQTGVPFDPTVHEAIATAPAAAPEQDHTVGTVFQAGYRLGGALVRAARVQVLTWSEPQH